MTSDYVPPIEPGQIDSLLGELKSKLSVNQEFIDARRSLSSFNEYISGEVNSDHHLEICESLDSWEDTTGILPRNSAKSTIASTRYPAYRLGQDRGLRILVASINATLAESFGRSTEAIFKTNRFKALFGDMIPQQGTSKWNESEKVVSNRPEFNLLGFRVDEKDASLFYTGVGGAVVGRRADIIILDDIIDRKNTKTEAQIEDTLHWYNEELKGSRHARTQMVIMGTRWSGKDIYIYIIDKMIRSGAALSGNMIDEVNEQLRMYRRIEEEIEVLV